VTVPLHIRIGRNRNGKKRLWAAFFVVHVRFWHKADISPAESQCPLLGVKRTLIGSAAMSAFDPKRTFDPEDCCHAK